MSPQTPLLAVILAVFFWRAAHVPLSGRRRAAVIACHLALIALIGLSLWGSPGKQSREVPRRVIYLVDGSLSIEPAQRNWMARRIASLEALRPQAIERAVVAFGTDAQAIAGFHQDRLTDAKQLQTLLSDAAINRARTNIESALLFGASLLPPQQHGAIILFTDGRETAGNVAGVLSYLRRFGVSVHTEPPPLLASAKTVWETLSAPAVTHRGSPVPVKLVVFNASASAKAAEVDIRLRGVSLKNQRLLLRPGWQVLTLPVRALARGTMAMEVNLRIPADLLEERRTAYTEVEGPPQVLFIQNQLIQLPLLAEALKRRDIDVAVIRPSEFPADAKRLLDYDAVMLFNLPKSIFSAEQIQAMRAYVETTGGGLITIGLGGRWDEELKRSSPLDALLPLVFEPKGLQEAQRRVCFVMLIDRSASMLGPRIAATKRAAVELVKQLSPEDLVGVLAFDTEPYIVAEVEPASQVGQWLVEKLVKLHSTGGTDIYPALVAAANRLDATGATTKHILLLTDGQTPFQGRAYDALVESLRRDGTTISAIGIGPAFVNSDFLRWLAASTGGSYFLMRRPEELPQLVVQDTKDALGKLPFSEGYFRPQKAPSSDWFADIAEWPALKGFFTVSAKPKALVDLTIRSGKKQEPLLARWMVGRGRVVSFASDADARWSPEWIRWPTFESAWAQIVRWALRPRLTEDLFVWVDESHATPQLVLEGGLDAPKADLLGADGSLQVPLSLLQTGPWRWQVGLDQVPSGWYQLIVESRDSVAPQAGGESAPVFAKRWVQLGTPPQGQETAGQPPQEPLLRQIAQSTDGSYASPDRALLPPTVKATVTRSRLIQWLPWVILLFLAEIALRGASML